MLLLAFIVSCLIGGMGAACAAPYAPAHVAVLERCGGILLIAGLASLGAALPISQL
jgi:hypothetical protein